jgi:hypothetical protein
VPLPARQGVCGRIEGHRPHPVRGFVSLRQLNARSASRLMVWAACSATKGGATATSSQQAKFKAERMRCTQVAVRKYAGVAVGLALSVTMATAWVAQPGDAAGGIDCQSSYDTYQVAPSALAACGVKTYPLLGQKTLADGGTAYQYKVDGMDVEILVPPAGFDAAAVGAVARDRYGIPREPIASDAERSEWREMVGNLQFVAGPASLHSVPSVRFTRYSKNWSGYYATGGPYTEAGATYTEPSPYSPACSGGSVGVWAGLGGVNTTNLAQNGTAVDAPGLGQHQAWYEILPYDPVALNLHATMASTFRVTTTRSSGKFYFFFHNSRTGATATVSVASSSYDGSTADAIVERPWTPGGLTPLDNFHSIPVQAFANDNYMSQYSYQRTIMTRNGASSGLALATPDAIDSLGKFHVAWQRCS